MVADGYRVRIEREHRVGAYWRKPPPNDWVDLIGARPTSIAVAGCRKIAIQRVQPLDVQTSSSLVAYRTPEKRATGAIERDKNQRRSRQYGSSSLVDIWRGGQGW